MENKFKCPVCGHPTLSGQNAKGIDRKLHEDFLNAKKKQHRGK